MSGSPARAKPTKFDGPRPRADLAEVRAWYLRGGWKWTEKPGERGRVRVYVGKGAPGVNSGGWQWRYRIVAQFCLGRVLRPDEHVNHIHGLKKGDEPENLEVVAAGYHGMVHAYVADLAGFRGKDGRFMEWDEPGNFRRAPRFGPIIGAAAVNADFY